MNYLINQHYQHQQKSCYVDLHAQKFKIKLKFDKQIIFTLLLLFNMIFILPLMHCKLTMTLNNDNYQQKQLFKINHLIVNDSNNITNNNNNNITVKLDDENFSTLDDTDNLKNIIKIGLGLKKLPDTSMINISHKEYTDKLKLYLNMIRERELNEYITTHQYADNVANDINEMINGSKRLFQFINKNNTHHNHHLHRYHYRHCNLSNSQSHNRSHHYHYRPKRTTKLTHDNYVYIRFQLTQHDLPTEIDESNLRLMIKSHKKHNHLSSIKNNDQHNNSITLKAYQLIEPYGRILLDIHKVQLTIDNNYPMINWLEFDVTKAIKNWLTGDSNLGFEIQCDKCHLYDIYIVHDLSPYETNIELCPVLNVIGKLQQKREKRSRQHRHFMQSTHSSSHRNGSSSQQQQQHRHTRKTDCTNDNQKCCRHRMDVAFKEIKGFEFIIQPKTFDAGYCHGKCPPRYNPAHHHAVLQSLIWKQNRNRAPRPCCAPSKLMELEVLHVDEDDSTKLKVSKWTDMRVLECACS